MVAACSMTPEYQRPMLPVPEQWPASIKVGADGAALSGWRQLFPQPALQALIAAALEHNRDLLIAVARVEEAAALAGVVRSERFPALDLTAQSSIQLSNDRTRTNASALSVTSFELDFWSRLQNLDAAARQRFLATDMALETFRQLLIADVASGYFSLIEMNQRTALAVTTVRSREQSYGLVVARRDAGLAGDLDVLAADTAMSIARADLANLSRQRTAAENALRLLVGSVSFDVSEVANAVMPELPFAGLSSAMAADVLLRRPDVKAAEERLFAANADVGAARAAWLPKLSLSLSASGGVVSLTPGLRLPLFDGGRYADNIDQANARKRVAIADYEKVIQQAYRETADLLDAQTRLAQQAQALAAGLVSQTARLKMVDARHGAGVSSYLELLDAQREEYSVRQSLLAVQRQQQTAVASLYKALGLL
jgi:multidrug efflux system outer membrane protein